MLVFRHDGKDVWHQGEFATGRMVGLETHYAFCNAIANGRKLWQAIPDEVEWLLLLPHPAIGATVKIVDGTHAGETVRIIGTHPPTARVTVQIGKETVDVAAADIEFLHN